MMLTTACAGARNVALSSPSETDPSSSAPGDQGGNGHEPYTAVYESTVVYPAQDAPADSASQVFSFVTPYRWTTISHQGGEYLCQARFDDLTWETDSDDCFNGGFAGGTRLSSGANTTLVHFPLNVPGFVQETWSNPLSAESVSPESLQERAASPRERVGASSVAAYRLADDQGAVLEWTIVEGDPVPAWLRQSGGGIVLELTLTELETSPRHVVREVLARVREAIGEQEELLRTQPTYQATE